MAPHRMTPARRAALKKAQMASARKRHSGAVGKQKRKKQPGKYVKQAGSFVRRGKTRPRRVVRGAAVGAAAFYTPYGGVLAGSAVRSHLHTRKARKASRKKARKK